MQRLAIFVKLYKTETRSYFEIPGLSNPQSNPNHVRVIILVTNEEQPLDGVTGGG